ncbi:ABC-F family ATP-binding cassette domain-containing protein [Paenibacillus wynnii]|uniref:ABC-F family ATP-binding cassette domain-containing protein n=1 Tax=Paenibacillus wynnii TaxID=268407 RepID=UPI002790009A|nr:ABC-F family ATP-binding cassette domain-containing protein [Paenibacillus wynnii]MDQ0194019.1 ATP-binding cassette subfamily F protein 3 [Paenibacillus wynnii]
MLLQATGITKSYGITSILDGISLQVNEKERVGLVGVNGAGKSTFLQILAGEMSYDGGQIHKSKETTIGYLAQNSGLQSERSIQEEMLAVFAPLIEAEGELRRLEQQIADPRLAEDPKRYEDLLEKYAQRSDWFKDHGGYEMNTRIRSILHGMGFGDFAPETPISTLSGGQKTRLALARILLQAPDLLLLDEPTNHLDIATLTWLEDYLRGYAGGILVVSHDRYFLDRLVTTIVEIERHQSQRYTGNYSRYMELKAAEYEIRLKQYDKQQDEISRMEDFVQRNIVRASTTKRAQSRRKALEKMDRLDKPMGDLKKANFSFEPDFMSGKEVLQVRDAAVAFVEGEPLFTGASFELRRGETAALIGPNGIGKSTLLQCLIGSREPSAGSVNWGAKVKIGYYDQEQTRLNPRNTVLEELWSEYPMLEEARIRTILGNFLFSGEDVLKRIAALSGGEKARVALSKLMLRGANMLILDEPTNHLDLVSREVLEAALMDFEGTLLFISHDRYFLNKMAERVLELHPNGIDPYLGNYDDYVDKKRELEDIAKEAAEQASAGASKNIGKDSATIVEKGTSTSFEADKQTKREERTRQRRIAELEENISSLEEEIAGIENEMTKPEVYQDYMALQEHEQDLKIKKERLAGYFSEWEILADE